ncbi:hypothetical protein MSAN_00129200 [Mycena sanguinolenta]|uniref:Uncharacterized protein n=1 Tax=Mycena sanguinolenta TaxID=230812 RepID=A0A8H6ZDM1_9AGAR|nr:hypothetical protein MSAN_00129200 [Mycena sanguinolenta]
MDGDQPNPTAEFTHSTTGNPEFPSHASGMFSHSQHFTIIGGTFTNITNNYYAAASSLPSGILPPSILPRAECWQIFG